MEFVALARLCALQFNMQVCFHSAVLSTGEQKGSTAQPLMSTSYMYVPDALGLSIHVGSETKAMLPYAFPSIECLFRTEVQYMKSAVAVLVMVMQPIHRTALS